MAHPVPHPPSLTAHAAGEALPADAVEVGRVLGAWGVQGGLKIKPFAADPQALFSSKRWYLRPPELDRPGPVAPAQTGPAAPLPALLRVKQAREHGDTVLATVHDIDDRDAAQALAGCRIFVPRTSFPTPGQDEFYWVDLIGLHVVNRQGQTLGAVTGLLETGPHCVLRVQPPLASGVKGAAGETLIPFVNAYVDEVDLPGRVLRVDWQADWADPADPAPGP
jgi:16S rRNA processing protein RimM